MVSNYADLFVTHAWRYHQPWLDMVALLDKQTSIKWRNFSIPWYDPAFGPHNQKDNAMINKNLEDQIRGVKLILFLLDVYQQNNNKNWLNKELALANEHQKPSLCIQLQSGGEVELPEFPDALQCRVVPWIEDVIIDNITTMSLGDQIIQP